MMLHRHFDSVNNANITKSTDTMLGRSEDKTEKSFKIEQDASKPEDQQKRRGRAKKSE